MNWAVSIWNRSPSHWQRSLVMLGLIVVAVLMVKASCALSPAPDLSKSPRMACAHWHQTQRGVDGANTVDAYRLEIRRAKAMGIDCFAYNVTNVSAFLPYIDLLYKAANLEGNFYLFPSADMCCSMSEADMDRLMLYRYDDPARLRVDGGRYGENLPVAQSWHGESKGTAFWSRVQNEWKSAGKPMFFIPNFHPYNGVEAEFDKWDDTVDGLYNFASNAVGDNALAGVALNHAYDRAADARPGMDAMFGCSPVFNRHSGTKPNENRIVGDFEGFHTWIECHKGLVADNPRFIEYVTWNDYLEGTSIGGPYKESQLWPTFRGNHLNHDAFREIAEYYLQWYKTGVQPAITTDKIAIAHRPHPENATSATGTYDSRDLPKQHDFAVVEDRLYAAVILKEPGTVTLYSGPNASQTFKVGAGVSEVSMPFARGNQRIALRRNGVEVLSAETGPDIVAVPSLYNYNVATAWAER